MVLGALLEGIGCSCLKGKERIGDGYHHTAINSTDINRYRQKKSRARLRALILLLLRF
jgi:hypothetical protein